MTQILHSLPYEDYNALSGLRAGDLHLLRRSPAHYKSQKDFPAERESEAFEFGRLFHAAVENPERFMDTFKVMPKFTGLTRDGRESEQSKEAKDKKAAWLNELPKGTIILPEKWADNLVGMLRAVTSHRILGQMVSGGSKELSIQVTDPETGETLKCRPDLVSAKHFVVDYKTTTDARPEAFLSQIYSPRGYSPFYVLNAAHYAHVARVADVGRENKFTIVAIEKERPWGIMVYAVDRGLTVGESHRDQLTRIYSKCRKADSWPGYDEAATEAPIPDWAAYANYPGGEP